MPKKVILIPERFRQYVYFDKEKMNWEIKSKAPDNLKNEFETIRDKLKIFFSEKEVIEKWRK